MAVVPSHPNRLGALASNFTDPTHERLIYFAAGGLVLLGVALLVATVVWWRGTKSEHAALAPLEVMSQRAWQRSTHVERARRLDGARPRALSDADDVQVNVPEEIDLDEFLRSFQPGFDDLRDQPEEIVAPAGTGTDEPADGAVAAAVAAESESESQSSDEDPSSGDPALAGGAPVGDAAPVLETNAVASEIFDGDSGTVDAAERSDPSGGVVLTDARVSARVSSERAVAALAGTASVDAESADPDALDAGSADPDAVEAVPVDPASVDEASSDPDALDAAPVDAESADPDAVEAVPVDPASVDSVRPDARSVDSVRVDVVAVGAVASNGEMRNRDVAESIVAKDKGADDEHSAAESGDAVSSHIANDEPGHRMSRPDRRAGSELATSKLDSSDVVDDNEDLLDGGADDAVSVGHSPSSPRVIDPLLARRVLDS